MVLQSRLVDAKRGLVDGRRRVYIASVASNRVVSPLSNALSSVLLLGGLRADHHILRLVHVVDVAAEVVVDYLLRVVALLIAYQIRWHAGLVHHAHRGVVTAYRHLVNCQVVVSGTHEIQSRDGSVPRPNHLLLDTASHWTLALQAKTAHGGSLLSIQIALIHALNASVKLLTYTIRSLGQHTTDKSFVVLNLRKVDGLIPRAIVLLVLHDLAGLHELLISQIDRISVRCLIPGYLGPSPIDNGSSGLSPHLFLIRCSLPVG